MFLGHLDPENVLESDQRTHSTCVREWLYSLHGKLGAW